VGRDGENLKQRGDRVGKQRATDTLEEGVLWFLVMRKKTETLRKACSARLKNIMKRHQKEDQETAEERSAKSRLKVSVELKNLKQEKRKNTPEEKKTK